MSTAFRCFAVSFAAAMSAVAVYGFSCYRHSGFYAAILVFPAAFYWLLAGYTFVPDSIAWLKRILIALMVIDVASQLFLLELDREWSTALAIAILGVYMAALLLLLYRRGEVFQKLMPRALPFARQFLLVAGAVLVLVSLFAVITSAPSSPGRGWEVLARRAHWITYYVNPLQDPTTDKIVALSSLFSTTGYALYFAAIVAAIATLVLAITTRPSRVRNLSWTSRIAGLSLLTTMWIFAETFWGWRFELHESRAAAALATVCWLAAIVLAAYFAFLVAHSSASKQQLEAYALFQLPLVAFSVPVWPVYFGEIFSDFPGICFLQSGLLLISLVYLGLVLPAESLTMATSEQHARQVLA